MYDSVISRLHRLFMISGVLGGLDLHGRQRSPVQTTLQSTAYPGDTSISVTTSVDWEVHCCYFQLWSHEIAYLFVLYHNSCFLNLRGHSDTSLALYPQVFSRHCTNTTHPQVIQYPRSLNIKQRLIKTMSTTTSKHCVIFSLLNYSASPGP